MSVRVVRLGTPRARDEGVRIGTVRRPPRGVRKEDYVRLDYYDTRQEAAARVGELKQRGIIGFVTDEPRATGASRR